MYGYVEAVKSGVDWSGMADIDGEDYEEWEKKLEPFHIQSGHAGDTGRYLAAEYFSASHRYWETIEPAKMVAQSDWDERLRGYAEVAGIDLGEVKPQWHLIAYFD